MMIWQDRNMLECFKVFYVKLYVHSLVDILKWFCENARCYNKIYDYTKLISQRSHKSSGVTSIWKNMIIIMLKDTRGVNNTCHANVLVYMTFIGPCIMIYFYSKTNEMHQCIKFILEWHPTCFGRSFRPSSGVEDCTYSNTHLSNRYCCLLATGCEMELVCHFHLVPTSKETAVICLTNAYCCMYSLQVLMMDG